MSWALDLARVRQASSSTPPLFGVILYTDAHANIKKTLRDQDYWSALDEISGTKWAVFATLAFAGKWGCPELPLGAMGMMVPVWKEPSANQELIETFELSDTKQLPVVVVFVLNGDELQRRVVPLDDSTLDTAFTSMREVFIKIADALDYIASENLNNPEGVFSAVDFALQDYKDKKNLKNAYRILKNLKEWLPF
ncbi:MAG: hypothetical protein ACYDG4_12320 [Desulfuromonadaceae bacterium]